MDIARRLSLLLPLSCQFIHPFVSCPTLAVSSSIPSYPVRPLLSVHPSLHILSDPCRHLRRSVGRRKAGGGDGGEAGASALSSMPWMMPCAFIWSDMLRMSSIPWMMPCAFIWSDMLKMTNTSQNKATDRAFTPGRYMILAGGRAVGQVGRRGGPRETCHPGRRARRRRRPSRPP